MQSSDTAKAVFAGELAWITDQKICDFVLKVFEHVDTRFFTIPATSSGMNHPVQSQGEGGLVRHTKMAVYFGRRLSKVYGLDVYETDLVIAALILHDVCKPNERKNGGTSDKWHDELVSDLIRNVDYPPYAFVSMLAMMTLRHMGPFRDMNGRFVEMSSLAQIVILADYVVSQKGLQMEDIDNLNSLAAPEGK